MPGDEETVAPLSCISRVFMSVTRPAYLQENITASFHTSFFCGVPIKGHSTAFLHVSQKAFPCTPRITFILPLWLHMHTVKPFYKGLQIHNAYDNKMILFVHVITVGKIHALQDFAPSLSNPFIVYNNWVASAHLKEVGRFRNRILHFTEKCPEVPLKHFSGHQPVAGACITHTRQKGFAAFLAEGNILK